MWYNTGSSISPYSLWSPNCLCLSWIRLHSAAPRGGRGADQGTTYLPCSPTTNDRPGNGGLSTPKERKQLMNLYRSFKRAATKRITCCPQSISPIEHHSIKLLTGHLHLQTRSIITISMINIQAIMI